MEELYILLQFGAFCCRGKVKDTTQKKSEYSNVIRVRFVDKFVNHHIEKYNTLQDSSHLKVDYSDKFYCLSLIRKADYIRKVVVGCLGQSRNELTYT